MDIVDARGYSCPQPVIMTMTVLKNTQGAVTILVDTDTAKENVIRAAGSKGWKLDSVAEDEGGYRVVISKA